jgi:hypothetical protein
VKYPDRKQQCCANRRDRSDPVDDIFDDRDRLIEHTSGNVRGNPRASRAPIKRLHLMHEDSAFNVKTGRQTHFERMPARFLSRTRPPGNDAHFLERRHRALLVTRRLRFAVQPSLRSSAGVAHVLIATADRSIKTPSSTVRRTTESPARRSMNRATATGIRTVRLLP